MKLSNFKAQVFKTFFVGLALIEVRYSQFHLCKANGIRSNTVGYILFILISDFNPIPRYLSEDILDLYLIQLPKTDKQKTRLSQ